MYHLHYAFPVRCPVLRRVLPLVLLLPVVQVALVLRSLVSLEQTPSPRHVCNEPVLNLLIGQLIWMKWTICQSWCVLLCRYLMQSTHDPMLSTHLRNVLSQPSLSNHPINQPFTQPSDTPIHPPHPIHPSHPSIPIHPSFHQVYGADELSSLETCMRILLGWGVSWQVDFPLPPAHIIDRIDGLLKHHDQRLHMHLHALEPAVLPGVIGMYVFYYTTTHTTTQPSDTP